MKIFNKSISLGQCRVAFLLAQTVFNGGHAKNKSPIINNGVYGPNLWDRKKYSGTTGRGGVSYFRCKICDVANFKETLQRDSIHRYLYIIVIIEPP